ncbi:MAG: sulfite exporter TauE/SafE family protein [Vicinamibacterales bacterium]
MIDAVLAGLALGAVGSAHCMAMCGPLVAVAQPREAAGAARYHLGRTLAYAGLGLVAGLTGGLVASAGFSRPLAIVAGLVLLGQAAVSAGLLRRLGPHLGIARRLTAWIGRAGAWVRRHQRTLGAAGPVAMGALNGLLPCGLVYAALAAAVGLGRVADGTTFMIAFGVGTTPALALAAGSAGRLAARLPRAVRRAAPVALAIVAVLLIARGLRAPAGDSRAQAPAASHLH